MGCIYAHVLRVKSSKQNGWMYIGQAEDLKKRWSKKENSYIACTFIYREMCKYGWDAFDHIIIEDNVPTELLDEREIYWIQKYHTCQYDPEYQGGFNLSFGGDGTRGPKPSLQGKKPKNFEEFIDASRKKIKCINSGTWNNIDFFVNQTWDSVVECAKYFGKDSRWAQHRLYGEWNIIEGPIFDYAENKTIEIDIEKRRRELKEKQRKNGKHRGSEHKTGSRINYNILCVETGEVFYKVADCLRAFDMGRATLNGHIAHPEIHQTAKGYHFKRIPKTTADS